MITLTKPLVFFDLETTGLDFINDRLIEISIIKLNIDKTIEKYHTYINPDGRKLSAEAYEKNKMELDFLNDFPKFGEIAQEIYDFISDCDLSGYNILKFDIPFLTEEFLRYNIIWDISDCRIFDSMKILQVMEPRTLDAVYKRMFNIELQNNHSAESDTEASAKIFNAQLKLYNLPNDPDELMNLILPEYKNQVDLNNKIKEIDGEYYITFGKYANQKLRDVYRDDKKYFTWMLTNDNFTREFKLKLSVILDTF